MKTKFTFKSILIIALVLLLSSNQNIAQNVGIGSTTFTPDPSAGLELHFSDKGFLLPRLSEADKATILTPIAEYLIILNTTSKCIEIYDDNAWRPLSCWCTVAPPIPTAGSHISTDSEIEWLWNTVPGATGYKWNTSNNYAGAIDLVNTTNLIQIGLACNTSYTIYIWAYNSCGYSTALTLTQSTALCPYVCGVDVLTDLRDNNIYTTVKIGNQCWMKKNLAYLPSVVDRWTGSTTTPYYYVYGYDGTNVSSAKSTSNYSTFGVLYNWAAAMSGAASSNSNPSGVQGICPTGWHLPSSSEWSELSTFLGTNVGGKLKQAGTDNWVNVNVDATNETGFTALPGGVRWDTGEWLGIGGDGNWWSTTQSDASSSSRVFMSNSHGSLGVGNYNKSRALSIRCIKDQD